MGYISEVSAPGMWTGFSAHSKPRRSTWGGWVSENHALGHTCSQSALGRKSELWLPGAVK